MKHFNYSEFDCKCRTCKRNGETRGEDMMDEDFLQMLDHARELSGNSIRSEQRPTVRGKQQKCRREKEQRAFDGLRGGHSLHRLPFTVLHHWSAFGGRHQSHRRFAHLHPR